MRYIFFDYETFYSKEYSLKRMNPASYVLDPRFQIIGAAVKDGLNGEPQWLDGHVGVMEFLSGLDASDTVMVYHNALFDAFITSARFNFIPRATFDTLSIARATLRHELKSLSLDNVAKHLGLGVKGDAVAKVEGMTHREIVAAGLMPAYSEYSKNDVELCAQIFKKLVVERGFPASELALMDAVIRCCINPKFYLDGNILAEHLALVQARKQALLARIGVNKEDLMSNDKFADALRSVGVEPPTKISLTTGKETYAFARTDPDFMALEEHESPEVQALHAARLGLKSTLEETRTERFIGLSRLQWPHRAGAPMPVPLVYSGAHTHRLSGDWKLNMQNMPRGGALRRALMAPPGHVVLAADSSQIEARIVAWICGQSDLVQLFANGEDVYSSFASKVFGRQIDKKKDPSERFIGKTAILGLGYGLGWAKFQRTIKLQSKAQTGQQIELSEEQAKAVVNTYRGGYTSIARTWRMLNDNISILASGGGSFKIGPCEFYKGRISLPSGLSLRYHDLKYVEDGWTYTYGGKPKRLYGGALLENIVQALARIVVMDAALRLQQRFSTFGIELALQVHDELVFVVPEEMVEVCKQIALEEMNRRPTWAPSLPLAAEAEFGPSYGDAK